MTKFEIDIDDCESGLRLFYKALVKKYGIARADNILWAASSEGKKEQREARRGIKPEDLGMLLAYCEMPNSRGLAKKLSQINKERAPDGPFGKNGSTNPDAMLRQIKRVLLRHSDKLDEIRALSPEQREDAAHGAMIGTLSRRRRIKKRGPKPKRK